MRVKGEGRDGEEEEEEERGVRMGESLLRMNAVSWAAPLLLPHTAICTKSLISDAAV